MAFHMVLCRNSSKSASDPDFSTVEKHSFGFRKIAPRIERSFFESCGDSLFFLSIFVIGLLSDRQPNGRQKRRAYYVIRSRY